MKEEEVVCDEDEVILTVKELLFPIRLLEDVFANFTLLRLEVDDAVDFTLVEMVLVDF
jgi:hypothetical protein